MTTNSPFTAHTLYEGRLVPKVDLAEQFARFAKMVKSKEPIGLREESELSQHWERVMHEKELGNN